MPFSENTNTKLVIADLADEGPELQEADEVGLKDSVAGGVVVQQLDNFVILLSKSRERTRELEQEVTRCHAEIAELRASYEKKVNEFEKFVVSGGALGSEVRDRIIRTLQEQLIVRDEEVNFYKSERLGTEEDQRRDERLLISTVHSIAVKYHEEMIRTFDSSPRKLSQTGSIGDSAIGPLMPLEQHDEFGG